MNTFVKCAEVMRIGFPHYSVRKRRFWLKNVLENYEKLRIIELDGGVLI